MHRFIVVARIAASLVAVGLVTLLYKQLLPVNPTTVALSYLVVILVLASGWGIAEATVASVAAVLCFNFYFLPPLGTFTVADPENWVALLAFLLTAAVTSQLSGRARQRQVEAAARQRDLERLYALSRGLLLSEGGAAVPGEIARYIADTFEMDGVALYDRRTDTVSLGGARELPSIVSTLKEVATTGATRRDVSGAIVTAIQLGGTPIGSVAVTDLELSDTVLRSVANLAAIGLERARADEATARAEAARESSELRATILDALAHEFKTPLTSMKAASSDLLASPATSARARELIEIIDEDLDRFQALVTDAVQMLRIDAGDFVVRPARFRLGVVVADVIRTFAGRLEGHALVQTVPDTMNVDVDRQLLALALRQLLDNALKYSPSDSTIAVDAVANGTVDIVVRNSGSTIPEGEQTRIFERFYRGGAARRMPGTGMGLAIVQQIAHAHGGSLTVSSGPERGTAFRLTLPRGATA